MIDVIINGDNASLTIAHDEKALDGFGLLEIAMSDGAVTLSGPAGSRRIGTLRPAMLEMVQDGMTGRMIRLSGWSLAKISPLTIRAR